MRFSLAALLVAAAALSAVAAAPQMPARRVIGSERTGRHIIRLRRNVNMRAFDRALKQTLARDTSAGPGDNQLVHQYTTAVKGYAGTFTQAVLDQLNADPNVAGIEEDTIGYIEGGRDEPVAVTANVQQPNATWGLARVAHRKLDLALPYEYPAWAGEGVTSYVIDTGVDSNNTAEFGDRASFGVNFVTAEPAQDLNGHGTHVAGTIMSATWGIAKKAKVVGVKVCTQHGSCSTADVVAGINWVVKNAVRMKSVINISLGLAASDTIDAAVKAAVDAGIAVVVSGGNANTDSCLNSPRRSPFSFAVGASTNGDQKASFSNYGKCLKIFAPGHQITSTIPGNKTDTWSGTSMASPHVNGIAALYLSDPSKNYASIADLYADMIARSTKSIVKGVPANTTTNLIYSLPSGGEPAEEPAPVVVPVPAEPAPIPAPAVVAA